MSIAHYVTALPSGLFEYGHWVCETGIAPVKKKYKKGVARTLDEAVERNGMTPLAEKGSPCSGKHSMHLYDRAPHFNEALRLSRLPQLSPLEYTTT